MSTMLRCRTSLKREVARGWLEGIVMRYRPDRGSLACAMGFVKVCCLRSVVHIFHEARPDSCWNTGEFKTAFRHCGDARRSGSSASVPTSSSEPLRSRNI